MRKTRCIALIGLLMSTSAKAEPFIIHDSGKTTPLQLIGQNNHYHYAPPAHDQTDFDLDPLPVITPSMTPGLVQSRKINRPYLNQAIFIVGADELSLTWLNQHRRQLKKHNAIGIAVNVKTQQELEQLVQASGGLAINPVVGDKIARQLTLKHYPVLVSATRIEQ